METVIVVWANHRQLEWNVPLLFNAKRNRRLGSRKQIHLIFIEGLDLLSDRYVGELRDAGYVLHDASALFRELMAKYSRLLEFSAYDARCFLRWLVIGGVFGKQPFVHYDGDVVFNATPEELEEAHRGLTFILQGCPAYSHIEDPSWLDCYTRELDLFYADMKGYSARAWERREEFLGSFREKNSGVWDHTVLNHDQDLLQYVTMAGLIPQSDAAALNRQSELALFQNPLCVARDIHMELPLRYERRDGVDYLSGKKVALWHMQADFSGYAGYAEIRARLGLRRRRIPLEERDGFAFQMLNRIRKVTPIQRRLWLYEQVFGEKRDLSAVLNGETFWEEGVFV